MTALKQENPPRRKAALWRMSGPPGNMEPEPAYHEEESETESEGDSEPSINCEDDRCRGPTPPIWHCVDCDSSYCRYSFLYMRVNRAHC